MPRGVLRRWFAQLLVAIGLGAALVGAAESPPGRPDSSAQTRYFLEDTGNPRSRYEVDFDKRQGKVHVQTFGSIPNLPDTMSLKLFNIYNETESVTLQATSPPPGSTKLHQQTTYGGELDLSNAPYVAFELQIPLESGDTRTLRAQMATEEQKQQKSP